MQALLLHVQQKSNSLRKKLPILRPGDRVKVHQKILENTKDGVKERIQIFEGLVMRISAGMGADKTFTVRKIASGVGVEKTYPLHSSNISKIEVVSHYNVRRAKLYYMRGRSGKGARLKEGKMREFAVPVEEPIEQQLTEEALQEAVAAEEARKKAEAEAAEAAGDASPEETPAEEAKA